MAFGSEIGPRDLPEGSQLGDPGQDDTRFLQPTGEGVAAEEGREAIRQQRTRAFTMIETFLSGHALAVDVERELDTLKEMVSTLERT